VSRLASYKWLMLTSQNAVARFWDALRLAGKDARDVAGIRVACVGQATADALLARGLAADVVPSRFVAEAVLEKLSARYDVKGTRVLYVAAEGARDVLPNGLLRLGAMVDVVRAYRTVSDGSGSELLRAALEAGDVDAVTFASASAVSGYVAAVGAELARRAPGISIGPVTSEAVRAAGITLLAESPEASVRQLAETTATALSNAPGNDVHGRHAG
jgi:uroporphyrinogen-III synthase